MDNGGDPGEELQDFRPSSGPMWVGLVLAVLAAAGGAIAAVAGEWRAAAAALAGFAVLVWFVRRQLRLQGRWGRQGVEGGDPMQGAP